MTRPGNPTAFEALVDDYDAGRPRYPAALFDALPLCDETPSPDPLPRRDGLPPRAGVAPVADVLELGAGTGIASAELASRVRSLVVTDLGPRMLARGLAKHSWPGAVCRAEALPFADGSFDLVCGAQMWHWTSDPAGAEVARVLRPGGAVALWWNEANISATGVSALWWDRQQDRLEAGNPAYSREYRDRDYPSELMPWFAPAAPVEIRWERTLTLDLYERWLRSKSYVQALPDVDAFVADCRADLLSAFPDGQVVEPFVTRLWLLPKQSMSPRSAS